MRAIERSIVLALLYGATIQVEGTNMDGTGRGRPLNTYPIAATRARAPMGKANPIRSHILTPLLLVGFTVRMKYSAHVFRI